MTDADVDAFRNRLTTTFNVSNHPERDQVVGTLTVLWLLRRHPDQRALWKKAADKALRKLASILNLQAREIEARLDALVPQP